MEIATRAAKDIEKLEAILREFRAAGLAVKYPDLTSWAENYLADARHFQNQKDYFSAFGAANYAFGLVDGILLIEKVGTKKCR